MRSILGLLAVGMLAGCASRLALPTLITDNGGCRGLGLDAILAGDPTDPRVAWLVNPNGARQDIIWPPGFTGRFTPRLEILDASSNVVFRAGDTVHGGCVAGPLDDIRKIHLIRPGY